MFSYQSVNGANIIRLEDSKKNGIWLFTQNVVFFFFFFFWGGGGGGGLCVCVLFGFVFQNIWVFFLFLVKTMVYPKHNLANSTFLGIEDTQVLPKKKVVNPLRG